MSRYIDAEWIRNVYADFEHFENRDDWTTPIANVLAVIDDAPSIDIVFCKECRHKYQEPWNNGVAVEGECEIWHSATLDKDFCSYGERKNDD